MGITLLIIGAILFVIGAIAFASGIPNMKRRGRIIRTPTSPIAQAPGNGPVEIKGRIAPSEQGLVAAPFSGRQAVWVRVTVQERRSSGRSSYWKTVVNEADGRPFMVDDGSGQLARVMPPGANVILDAQKVADSGTFRDAPPHLEAFLNSRGLKSTSFLGFNKAMRYEEQVLAPGDDLYAIGPSRREPGPPVSDGYRMVPGSQLVLYAGQGAAGELILTNKTEEQLVSRLLWGFVGGAIAGGLGFLLAAAGAIVQIFDLAN
jgi:E3 ubiquitin ligase